MRTSFISLNVIICVIGPSPNSDDCTDEAPVVFISYKWEIQHKVEQLKEKIESKGIKCWMDKNEMKRGDVLSKEIDKGIRGCKVILTFSKIFSMLLFFHKF